MDINQAAHLVSEWARKKPEIKNVQFFGSRVKGANREDSDLDVAIELIQGLDECGGLSAWMRNSDKWSKELNELIPYEVQAEWNDGENTDLINKGLLEACLLVYEE
ncbi:hypothetical protein LCGC14_0484130 [marine sediment metagenome]|uniref:Polymerase beta nucleotidyltransferase domain-containing protein n=1 Tax=marine sediment metagenome TaxID=412755 RepID=A0A0F9VH81_9ZZZZ|nr:nucleotidyltransferase domain-containing protein [Methylophaga sp.]